MPSFFVVKQMGGAFVSRLNLQQIRAGLQSGQLKSSFLATEADEQSFTNFMKNARNPTWRTIAKLLGTDSTEKPMSPESTADKPLLGTMAPSPYNEHIANAPETKRKVSLLQEAATAHENPSGDSAVKLTFKTGDVLYLFDVVEGEGRQWVRVRDTNGSEGFLPGDTRIQDVVIQRFFIERVAFIAVASIIVGLIYGIGGPESDIPAVGVVAMTAFLMTGVYVTAKRFLGIGGFFEVLPADTRAPGFDWSKFLLEPLILLGVTLAVFLFVGLVMLFRWAMNGPGG